MASRKAEDVLRAMQTRRAFRHVNGYFGTYKHGLKGYYLLIDETGAAWFVYSHGQRASADFTFSLDLCLKNVARGVWEEFDPPE